MAGTSERDVKNRIKSVESTVHITKAMELVASSKLKKAKERVDKSRHFFETMYSTLNGIALRNTDFASVFVKQREVKKICYVVIAGDRGLAGGYNGNVFKLSEKEMDGKNCCVLPIGKKTVEFFNNHRFGDIIDSYSTTAQVTLIECAKIGRDLAQRFKNGEYDELFLIYTRMNSMLSQSERMVKLLPVLPMEEKPEKKKFILYEPSAVAVYDAIVPEYISGMIYGAICESEASELAARRMAMDAATRNANDMIESLTLRYNRARQAAITAEITEIVAGANAQ